MEHIRTKEQAMAWLMNNKQIRKKRLEQLQAIAIKKYEERTGLKANYVEVFYTSKSELKSVIMETEHKDNKKYRISPRLKSLMGKVTIDPKDFEDDDRLQYILNK